MSLPRGDSLTVLRPVESIPVMTSAVSSGAHFQIFGVSLRSPLRWRLLSGNNREIGRSVAEFPDTNTCSAAVEALQAGIDDLEGVMRRVGHEWTWQLLDSGVPVVMSGHNYDRRIRCERALTLFVQRAGHAPTTANVMLSAARRWSAGAAGRGLAIVSGRESP